MEMAAIEGGHRDSFLKEIRDKRVLGGVRVWCGGNCPAPLLGRVFCVGCSPWHNPASSTAGARRPLGRGWGRSWSPPLPAAACSPRPKCSCGARRKMRFRCGCGTMDPLLPFLAVPRKQQAWSAVDNIAHHLTETVYVRFLALRNRKLNLFTKEGVTNGNESCNQRLCPGLPAGRPRRMPRDQSR